MGQARARIRQAEADDIEDIIALELRTIRESYASFLGQEAVEGFIRSGAVETFVRENAGRTQVATLDGTVVGCVVATDNHIDQLMIDVRFHRQGLGSQLLENLESELFKDYQALFLETFRDNHQAIAFYQKHSWTVVGGYSDENHGVDMIKLRKEAP